MAKKQKKRQAELRAQEPSTFVDIFGLSDLTGIPIRSLRTLIQKRSLPFLKLGHRTMLFEPAKVIRALHSFEIKPINPNGGGRA